MKKLLSCIVFILVVMTAFCQSAPAPDRMDWWRDARFGMFIHWGLYAVPAGEWNGKTGYGEWIRNSAEIPIDTYDHFREQFNPVKFNADEWVKMARDAGMKYIVITTKHHDGFCMFNTGQTDFSIMNTPFHHDPMKDLATACHRYGLKFCFYYSIMDWHHPDYLPRRSWEKSRTTDGADFGEYVSYMKAELKELLTNYGDIGVLWFDGEWENTWNEKYGKEIYLFCRNLQPGIIINNRVGAGRLDMEGLTREGAFGGDFGTPEQQIPATGLPGVDWETCMTMNDHWGYNKADKNFKSAKELMEILADIASKGGNYLLNVGPTSQGVFPDESITRLRYIAEWMKVNGESIWGAKASPFRSLDWGRCTRKEAPQGDRLYLHVFNWPKDSRLILPGVLNEQFKAFLLSDPGRQGLKVTRQEDALLIALPERSRDSLHSVVVIDFKGKLDLTDPPDIVADFDRFVDSMKITLRTSRENVEIRFTIDGSECNINSPLYLNPFHITKAVKVNARCYRKGKPVSGTSTSYFTLVDPKPALSVINPELGLAWSYYEGSWDSIPDFSGLKPLKEGHLGNFLLDPAAVKEYYGFSYDGYINIPETGMYAFHTESDDGSALWIDGEKIVDNDGLHGAKEAEGVVPLGKGYHSVRVSYFNKTGGAGLTVSIRSSEIKKELIPDAMLFHK